MIPCPLWRQAKTNSSAIAMRDGSRTWTFKEWSEEADKWAHAIKSSGIDSSCAMATVADDPFKTAAQLFGAIRSGHPVAFQSDRDPIDAISDQRRRLHFTSFPEKPSEIKAESDITPMVDEQAIATILFTSGSTSRPKAVCHSLSNHLHAAMASEERTPFGLGDRWGLSLSLWHIGGLAILFRAIVSGGSILCIPKNKGLDRAIKREGLTHLSLVAMQLNSLLNKGSHPEKLKSVLIGGGSCPGEVYAKGLKSGFPLKMTYGMTELASQFCTQSVASGSDNAGSPLTHWSIKIAENGEICAKGPALFMGYLSDSGIKPARDEDGWFHTGDLGVLENGILYPKGRIDQRFISGGENISPEEIEQAVLEHPLSKQAIVVGVPDLIYGQRPVLFYLGDLSEKDLKKWLEKKLAKFKQPDHIYPWPSEISLFKPSRSALLQLAMAKRKPETRSI